MYSSYLGIPSELDFVTWDFLLSEFETYSVNTLHAMYAAIAHMIAKIEYIIHGVEEVRFFLAIIL